MRRAAFLLLILSGSARAFEEAGSAERNLAKMIRALETGSWTERIHAVHELEYMHDEAIPGLALAMEDGDWQVRLTAVQALSPRSAEGITAMKKLLKHETCPVVRLMTMHALGSQGPSADEQRKVMSWMSSASTKEVNTCQDQAGPGKAPWARGAAPRRRLRRSLRRPRREPFRPRRPRRSPRPLPRRRSPSRRARSSSRPIRS
ncbi:MAG: HEAT repeat domain-containing protein [Elusimicrobiota bacterium]|nr:MAG: HEAT repeat domain-containing protein [Elusimicrobiota bacterium]